MAGPLFLAIFLTAGALRPDYDPLRHPVSSLEFGPGGWVQRLNFLLTGTLVTLFGLSVRSPVRKLGGGGTVPILFMAVGIGLIGAALFEPDPLSGYPLGTPPAALTRRCTGYCTTSSQRRCSPRCPLPVLSWLVASRNPA